MPRTGAMIDLDNSVDDLDEAVIMLRDSILRRELSERTKDTVKRAINLLVEITTQIIQEADEISPDLLVRMLRQVAPQSPARKVLEQAAALIESENEGVTHAAAV